MTFIRECFVCDHFELIFVYSMKVCSNFIDLYAAVQFSQHNYLFPLNILASFVKEELTISVWIYFWALCSNLEV